MAQRVSMVAKYRFGTAPGSSRSRRRYCSLASSSSPERSRSLTMEAETAEWRPDTPRLKSRFHEFSGSCRSSWKHIFWWMKRQTLEPSYPVFLSACSCRS